ncbi:MAG TPA: hypothetical protein VG900_06480 [Hyphomicrobiaceae bacterium]|jgi:hypothetical protein|nr:hypothetical protein [Hyphomicrobiaceae bacterium]
MRSNAVLMGALAGACALWCAAGARAQPQQSGEIERLLADGWEVAGYISAWENRSLILFKHKDRKYLVQCSVLTDVLRNPRLVIHCSELR